MLDYLFYAMYLFAKKRKDFGDEDDKWFGTVTLFSLLILINGFTILFVFTRVFNLDIHYKSEYKIIAGIVAILLMVLILFLYPKRKLEDLKKKYKNGNEKDIKKNLVIYFCLSVFLLILSRLFKDYF